MLNSHCHTVFSHDGKQTIDEVATKAKELSMSYLAITEHLDRDYLVGGLRERLFFRQLDLKSYAKAFPEKQRKYNDDSFYLAFGVEAGFNAKCIARYMKELTKYDFDVIVNSIHTLDGKDIYFKSYFNNRDEDYCYNKYLDSLYESVIVPYPYQVVGHIGYIARYAPYENYSLLKGKYEDKTDAILKEIIARKKTVEINTHITHCELSFLPEAEVLKRYKELGGTRLTFSDDSHKTCDLGFRYSLASITAKELGFDYWTYYKKQREYTLPIE